MSCSGCVYLIGKDGRCDQSYVCNTTGERPQKEEVEKRKSNKKRKSEEQQ